MNAVQNALQVRIPFINFEFELSALDKKVLSVALASLFFFGVQFGLPLAMTFGITCAVTSLTYLCEKFLRIEQNDWFNTDFDKKPYIFLCSMLILKPFIVQIVCWALGLPLLPLPQEGLISWLLANPLKVFPIAAIGAPLAEEILFRGCLLERLEDLMRVCRIPGGQTLSEILQATVFGAIHLRAKIQENSELFVLFFTSLFGYISALIKRDTESLIPAIGTHSSNNIGFTLYILNQARMG